MYILVRAHNIIILTHNQAVSFKRRHYNVVCIFYNRNELCRRGRRNSGRPFMQNTAGRSV